MPILKSMLIILLFDRIFPNEGRSLDSIIMSRGTLLYMIKRFGQLWLEGLQLFMYLTELQSAHTVFSPKKPFWTLLIHLPAMAQHIMKPVIRFLFHKVCLWVRWVWKQRGNMSGRQMMWWVPYLVTVWRHNIGFWVCDWFCIFSHRRVNISAPNAEHFWEQMLHLLTTSWSLYLASLHRFWKISNIFLGYKALAFETKQLKP